jgi:hypothetical protein
MMAGTIGLSWGEQVIKSPKKGVEVELKSDLSSMTATAGQPFEAELKDDLRYDNLTLPAGTDFRGEVTKASPSKHFGRPGYVGLQVREAVLPDGRTFEFDPVKYEPRDQKLHHPDTYTFPELILTQMPYTLIALAVTVPLNYAADVDPIPLIAVGEGVRIAAGAIGGLFRPRYRNEPVPRKIALGALDGSGVPRIVGFIGKYPEPDFHAGDHIKLYFNPNGLTDLMQAASTTSLNTHAELQRAAQLPAAVGE